jgi:hypothetical protein
MQATHLAINVFANYLKNSELEKNNSVSFSEISDKTNDKDKDKDKDNNKAHIDDGNSKKRKSFNEGNENEYGEEAMDFNTKANMKANNNKAEIDENENLSEKLFEAIAVYFPISFR